MTTNPPQYKDNHTSASALLENQASYEKLDGLIYDVSGQQKQQNSAIISYTDKEQYTVVPTVTTLRTDNRAQLELGKSSSITLDMLGNDATHIKALLFNLTLPKITIDAADDQIKAATAIGYCANFIHHLFDEITVMHKQSIIFSYKPSINDLRRALMQDQEKKYYDKIIGNVPELLLQGLPDEVTRKQLPSMKVSLPIIFETPFILPRSEDKNALRLIVNTQPLLSAIVIRNVDPSPSSGTIAITKNHLKTYNKMNQIIPIGDVKYSINYETVTTKASHIRERHGLVTRERYTEIAELDAKNIDEDGDIIGLFPASHSALYVMVQNVTAHELLAVTGAEQSMYSTNPVKDDGGNDPLVSSRMSIHGYQEYIDADAHFTNATLPFMKFAKTLPKGYHMLYCHSESDPSRTMLITGSGFVNMENLRPAVSFTYSDDCKKTMWRNTYDNKDYKTKYKIHFIVKELYGLNYGKTFNVITPNENITPYLEDADKKN